MRKLASNALICWGISFCLQVYANEAFQEFRSAMLNKAPKITIQKLSEKYRGERIEGKGYVVSLGDDISGNLIVNISTTKDFSSPESINIVVFLRKYFIGKKLRFKNGDYVRFSGIFQELRMNTLLLQEGIVK